MDQNKRKQARLVVGWWLVGLKAKGGCKRRQNVNQIGEKKKKMKKIFEITEM